MQTDGAERKAESINRKVRSTDTYLAYLWHHCIYLYIQTIDGTDFAVQTVRAIQSGLAETTRDSFASD